jgi:streptomycin 3"-adenylyltransferase
MEDSIDAVVAHLDRNTPGDFLGFYAFGSLVSTGLRPDSDVDLLLLTQRALTDAERVGLVTVLLELSGWKGHAETFPEAADRRPIELTSLVIDECENWRAAPLRDFQYGEWLRRELISGRVPSPVNDPDVLPLMATAQQANTAIRGPALETLVPPVPSRLLHQALVATVPDLVDGLRGDERNVLLTLSRIIVTLETGQIVSKDAAAQHVAASLDTPERRLLERARAGYLGAVSDDWRQLTHETAALAAALTARIQAIERAPSSSSKGRYNV